MFNNDLYAGILRVAAKVCYLKDMEGKDIGKSSQFSKKNSHLLTEGKNVRVSGKEVEV